jgi:hypothetical protein
MKNLKLFFLSLVVSLSTYNSYSQTSRSEIIALINTIQSGTPNTAAKIRSVLTRMIDPPIGTIRIRDVSNAYITANFDGTGKGVNEELGYAICNGTLAGTRNWAGKTLVGYGTGYTVMGATGGNKDAVVVKHEHVMGDQSGSSGSGTTNVRYIGKEIESNALGEAKTDSTGVSGVDKNMQPYIVTLVTVFIGYD